ncbi:hypothetical protein M3Y98_00051900 [Aphelenchoides besseyi]|nr:hypothetical protein M3Y98_00051900 [Aphelenchoides besseyi]
MASLEFARRVMGSIAAMFNDNQNYDFVVKVEDKEFKNTCKAYFEQNLNIRQIFSYLVWSYIFGDSTIKDVFINYAVKNIVEIQKSDQYSDFFYASPSIIFDLFNKVAIQNLNSASQYDSYANNYKRYRSPLFGLLWLLKLQMEAQLELMRLLEQSFNDEHQFDFIVKVENTEFKVFKYFLTLNSEVFKRMIEGNFSESKESAVEIKDFSAEPIKHLLRFCYCGKLEVKDEELLVKVYEAADKYQIHQLKLICSKKLGELMKASTVIERLMWAEKYKDDTLMKTLVDQAVKNIEFISENSDLQVLFLTLPEIALKLFLALAHVHRKQQSQLVNRNSRYGPPDSYYGNSPTYSPT